MPSDYYAVLEVSPRASKEVVKAAYRALALAHATDNDALARINEAGQVLTDDDERIKYDEEYFAKPKGKMIGNYRLVKEIATGGFGTTYLGEHVVLGTPVAIKHAHNVSLQDEALMMEEAKAVWDLRHWAIPAVREIIKLEDGSYAIVMSYCPGHTLAQFVEKHGGLEPEHACWIIERVLNALKYLHLNSVVHGDVKPQNIIIQSDNHTVTLVDYGLSLVRPRRDTVNKGYTPLFASPEQEKGMPLLPESDLFSLGVTFIYALGGDVPARRVPNNTPDPICDLIKKMVAFNPMNRPNWQKEDLCKTISDVREKAFGRRWSNMKPLKF